MWDYLNYDGLLSSGGIRKMFWASANSLDSVIKERIMNRLSELVDEPDTKGKPLTSFRKMRIGVYRIIDEMIWNDTKVNVFFIRHRTKVYVDFKRIFFE